MFRNDNSCEDLSLHSFDEINLHGMDIRQTCNININSSCGIRKYNYEVNNIKVRVQKNIFIC